MSETTIERLYDFVTGDEDARVCRDIPDAACRHQPRNFFAYLGANVLNKIADELSSAKLILPWMLGALGAPMALTGLLVPIREAGVLLPQLLVAAAVRGRARRKGVWLLGAALSALALAAMAAAVSGLEGTAAGLSVVALLMVYSVARGFCSVAAKDVLGKTVSKRRRGLLMGWSASLGGAAVVLIGLGLAAKDLAATGAGAFALLLGGAAALWLAAMGAFNAIREEPGATEGGGNALAVAWRSLGLLRSDVCLRRFVIGRSLLLAVALAPPFFVLLAQRWTGGALDGLGWLIVATGLGASVSSPLWGRFSDRSSRTVMSAAATGHGVLALAVCLALWLQLPMLASAWFWAGTVVALTVLHSGVRLGRKTYLVDMADSSNRAQYVAVSNTVIGLMMLLGGAIGVLGDWVGTASVVLLLAMLSFAAALYVRSLPEVSDQARTDVR